MLRKKFITLKYQKTRKFEINFIFSNSTRVFDVIFLRKRKILFGWLVVILLVVGRMSQNVRSLPWTNTKRWGQLSFINCKGFWVLVFPFVHWTTSCIHKEVSDRRGLQAQLSCYCHLHFLRRPLRFLKIKKKFNFNLNKSSLKIN